MTDILTRSETLACLQAQADEDIVFRSALTYLNLYFDATSRWVAWDLLTQVASMFEDDPEVTGALGDIFDHLGDMAHDMTEFVSATNSGDPVYEQRKSFLLSSMNALWPEKDVLDLGVLADLIKFLINDDHG